MTRVAIYGLRLLIAESLNCSGGKRSDIVFRKSKRGAGVLPALAWSGW